MYVRTLRHLADSGAKRKERKYGRTKRGERRNTEWGVPKPPWGGVGQFFLGESQFRLYPHMRAKFWHGPMAVSK